MVDLLIAHPIFYLILCINSDGTVDLADLAIFSSRWLMPDQD